MARLLCLTIALMAALPASGSAQRAEPVFLAEIPGPTQVTVVRRSGDAFLIEHGTGCSDLGARLGRNVLISFAGSFLEEGSRIVLNETEGDYCRVRRVEPLGRYARPGFRPGRGPGPGWIPGAGYPPGSVSPGYPYGAGQPGPSRSVQPMVYEALSFLGYTGGAAYAPNGQAIAALLATFQRDWGVRPTGQARAFGPTR